MAAHGLSELIDTADPAWSLVQAWIANARHLVTAHGPDITRAEQTLIFLQVTTHSVLGGITWETGGLLIDHGWLRLLGGGCAQMLDSLFTWNTLLDGEGLPGTLIVAHDAVGGFFTLNGGAFTGERGDIHYFAPDSLAWEDLGMGYSAFVEWALRGDLATFYANTRWSGWEGDCAALDPSRGFSIYPPLWTKGPPIGERSRRAVPMIELWRLQHDYAQQIRIDEHN